MLNKALLSIPSKSIQNVKKNPPDSLTKNNHIAKGLPACVVGSLWLFMHRLVFCCSAEFSDKKISTTKVLRMLLILVCMCVLKAAQIGIKKRH